MKIVTLILVGIMVLPITIGCNRLNERLEYDVLNKSELSEDLMPLIESMKKDRGFITLRNEEENYNYIVISSGEKSTGGYGLKVKSIEDADGIANIVIEETVPRKGSMVTQAFTYPYIILELEMDVNDFHITDVHGNDFRYIFIEKNTARISEYL